MELLLILIGCVVCALALSLCEIGALSVGRSITLVLFTVLMCIFVENFYERAIPIESKDEHLGRPASINFYFQHGKVSDKYVVENISNFYIIRTTKHRPYSASSETEYKLYKEFAENGAKPVLIIKTNSSR